MSFTTDCKNSVDMFLLLHCTCGIAILILVVLQLLDYYKEKKFKIITPFLFLRDNDCNRLVIVTCFGAMVSQLIQIMLNNTSIPSYGIPSTIGVSLSTTFYLVELAIVFLPTFVCATSRYVMVSAVIGTLYSLFKLAMLFLQICYITDCTDRNKHILYNMIANFPNILCYIALVYNFMNSVYQSSTSGVYVMPKSHLQMVQKHQVEHVRHIFNGVNQTSCSRLEHYRSKFWNKRFQFSTEFLSCIFIILIVYYYLAIIAIKLEGDITNFLKSLAGNAANQTKDALVLKLTNGLLATYKVSVVVTCFFYAGLLIHFCHNHRENSLRKFAGHKLPFVKCLSYRTTLQYNLSFMGYMVAYMTWGMVVFFVVFGIASYAIYAFIVTAIELHQFRNVVLEVLKYILSAFLIPLMLYIVQVCLVFFVFMMKPVTPQSTAINNMKAYHLSIYFLFFFNVIIGYASCIFTSVKAFIVSIILLGRIDKTSMPTNFFKRYDAGFRAYTSFLHVQTSHTNPTMRCFCQILLSLVYSGSESNEYQLLKMENPFLPILQQYSNEEQHVIKNSIAFNRWFVALTLARNLSLLAHRKKKTNVMSSSPQLEIDFVIN